MKETKQIISENQQKVLKVLADAYPNDEANCMYFKGIASETKLEVRVVRLACRALARKGLAQYVRGLFDEDGMVAGSGYCATFEGAMFINACTDCKMRLADMDDKTCEECWRKSNNKIQ